MLFSQRERLVLDDSTRSLMNVGQLCGHSCLSICNSLVKHDYNNELSANLDECKVKLVDIGLLFPERHLIRCDLDSHTDNKITNTFATIRHFRYRYWATHLAARPLGDFSTLFGLVSQEFEDRCTWHEDQDSKRAIENLINLCLWKRGLLENVWDSCP